MCKRKKEKIVHDSLQAMNHCKGAGINTFQLEYLKAPTRTFKIRPQHSNLLPVDDLYRAPAGFWGRPLRGSPVTEYSITEIKGRPEPIRLIPGWAGGREIKTTDFNSLLGALEITF